MADTLCGPSNALQSFRKHTQVDRTLQQDRLTGPRHSPTQGFRSFDPRTGSLDADFHAFENAAPSPLHFADPLAGQASSYHAPAPFARGVQAPMATAGWANDFQSLSITDRPVPAQNFRMEAPLVRSAPGDWQSEFMRQREQHANLALNSRENTVQSRAGMMMQQTPFQNQALQNSFSSQTFSSQDPMYGQHEGQVQNQNQNLEQLSSSDWSQAFQEAFDSASLTNDVSQTQAQSQSLDTDQILHQDGTYTNDRSQMEESANMILEPQQTPIGADAISYTEVQDRTAEQNVQDANSLARVAGELLHNIQHESDTKFQNSQFLELMRRIRDREIEVRNDEFEVVGATNLADQTLKGKQRADPTSIIDARPPSPHQQGDSFTFPDMNQIFEPTADDHNDVEVDYNTLEMYEQPITGPRTQMQALHPGGRLYPGSSSSFNAPAQVEASEPSMSGARPISAADFDYVDESRTLGSKFGTSGP